MATNNPYAPPSVDTHLGSAQSADSAPPLYNPDAAANWSLLFSPIFGSYLHWQNWKALGEERGLGWFIASIVGTLGIPMVTEGRLGIAVLLAWYFIAARPQAKYVKERWGTQYPRQSMAKAVLVAFVIFVAFVAAAVGFLFTYSPGMG